LIYRHEFCSDAVFSCVFNLSKCPELQRRNLSEKCCLENPNKRRNKNIEPFKLLGFKIPSIYRTIIRFEKQEKEERKIGSGKNCALSSSKARSKVRTALKKENAGRRAKPYNTDKKYLTKMEVHYKAKTSAPKTTARQQSVIKARLKLLTQNFFSAKSIYKCVMDDESFFTVDGNEWKNAKLL
jgi:hypothetical protein